MLVIIKSIFASDCYQNLHPIPVCLFDCYQKPQPIVVCLSDCYQKPHPIAVCLSDCYQKPQPIAVCLSDYCRSQEQTPFDLLCNTKKVSEHFRWGKPSRQGMQLVE